MSTTYIDGFGLVDLHDIPSLLSIITANSASYTDVNAAVASASAGDTVVIPPGIATWGNTLVINKSLTLQGSGTANTRINRQSGFNGDLINITSLPSDVPVRITGIFFDNVVMQPSSNTPDIDITNAGNSPSKWSKIRIDHCTFNAGQHAVSWQGYCYGVTDHCTFTNVWVGVYLFGGCGDFGDTAWARGDSAAGSGNFAITEDCTFTLTNAFGAAPGSPWVTYHEYGGKSVLRHCTIDSSGYSGSCEGPVDAHGNQSYWQGISNDYRGTIRFEFYNNTVKINNSFRLIDARGGSFLIHDNIYTCTNSSPNIIDFRDEEDDSTSVPFSGNVRSPVHWPCEDQPTASFIYNNTYNGVAQTNAQIGVGTFGNSNASTGDPFYIQLNRDYWTSAPAGGTTTAYPAPTGQSSGSYPAPYAGLQTTTYTPYAYPHPLIPTSTAPTLAQALVNSTTISGSTAYGTFASNTVTGDSILVFSYFSGNPLATVTGIAVNAGAATFTKILAVPGVAGSIPSLEVWLATNITGGTTPRVTATYSSAPGATAADLVLYNLTGVPTIFTPDGVPAGSGNVTAATALASPKISPTQSGSLVFAAFATGSAVTAGLAGWTNTVTQHLSCAVEYQTSTAIQNALGASATQTSSLAYGTLILALASASAVPVCPAQASAQGFSVLSFSDEFLTAPDIGFGTAGHKWNAGLFYQPTPPSSCFTNNQSIETITAKIPQTPTVNSFTIPAQNTAVAITLSASGYSAAVGDSVLIQDGTNNLFADVTIVTDATHITINPKTYAGNPTSGTMGAGATIAVCNNVNLCTQQQDGGGGINFLQGYYEAYLNLTDFAAFWLFNAGNKAGTPGDPNNPFTWNNELDIIEGDPGASFLSNATTTLHKNTNGIGGVADSQNGNNNNATTTPVMNVWNKFGALWTANAVTWYFNDVAICTTPTYASTNKFMSLILNASKNGVNGSASTVIPPNLQMDWVRVWQAPLVDLGATLSIVQSAQAVNGPCTLPGVNQGDAIVVFAWGGPAFHSPNCTDTLGNQYYTIPLTGIDNGQTHQFNAFYCKNSVAGGNNQISIARSGLTYTNIIAFEIYMGGSALALLDQAACVASSGASMTSASTRATQIAHEIVFGYFATPAGVISAGQAGYTQRISSDGLALAQAKIVSALGVQNTTATQSTTGYYVGATLSFYAVAQPAAPVISVPHFPTLVTATTTQTPSQTFGGPVAQGNTIIAFVSWDSASGSVQKVVDNVNGPNALYTLAGVLFQGAGESQALYYLPNSLPGTPTVTATLDSSRSGASVCCIEVAGLSTAPVFDQTTQFHGTSGTALNSGNITTQYANEILIGGARCNGQNITAGGFGWTEQQSFRTGIQYLIVNGTGTYASLFTSSGTAGWLDGIWSFAPGSPPPPIIPPVIPPTPGGGGGGGGGGSPVYPTTSPDGMNPPFLPISFPASPPAPAPVWEDGPGLFVPYNGGSQTAYINVKVPKPV